MKTAFYLFSLPLVLTLSSCRYFGCSTIDCAPCPTNFGVPLLRFQTEGPSRFSQNELDSIKQETKRKFDAGLSKKQTLIKQIKEIQNKKKRADTKLQILSDQMSTGQTNMKEILSANAAVYQISDQVITLRSELTILQYELARNSDSLLNFIDFDVTVSTENVK